MLVGLGPWGFGAELENADADFRPIFSLVRIYFGDHRFAESLPVGDLEAPTVE